MSTSAWTFKYIKIKIIDFIIVMLLIRTNFHTTPFSLLSQGRPTSPESHRPNERLSSGTDKFALALVTCKRIYILFVEKSNLCTNPAE